MVRPEDILGSEVKKLNKTETLESHRAETHLLPSKRTVRIRNRQMLKQGLDISLVSKHLKREDLEHGLTVFTK